MSYTIRPKVVRCYIIPDNCQGLVVLGSEDVGRDAGIKRKRTTKRFASAFCAEGNWDKGWADEGGSTYNLVSISKLGSMLS